MMYGPQTIEIEALIEKISNMPEKQAVELKSAWDANWNTAWEAAWIIAREAARNAGRWAARDAAHGAVWDSVAYGAARDAVLALLVKDKISAEDFDTLYGPWKSVMGS